jgi:hypothetical protein
VEKCVTCQYYDRRNSSPADGKGPMWGQCRRSAPMLHPVNAKSYMIEGVWPHVRDDDWCGEFRSSTRRAEPRVTADAMSPSTLLPISAGSSLGTRPTNVSPFSSASSRDEAPVSLGPLMSAGRGAD